MIDKYIERIEKILPTPYLGILSVSIGILGDIISYVLFPFSEYDFLKQAVSALCLGSGGIFFNICNILSGIFAFLFVNALARTFDDTNISNQLKKTALICANISCICFIILGAFCGSNLIIAYIHGTAALTSWGFGLLYITLYNTLIIKDSKYSKKIGYFGYIVSFLLALLLILFILHLFPIWNREILIILPFLEWLNTFGVIFWYYMVSFYIIYKKI
jgi:hypothetical protein